MRGPSGPWIRCLLLLSLAVAGCGDFLGIRGGSDPAILSVHPGKGEVDVSVHTDVRVRFSVDLDTATVGDGLHLIQGDRALQVTIHLLNQRELILEPTEPLDFGTSFQVAVAPTLRRKSGKSLSDQESWSFLTEGSPLPLPHPDTMRAHMEVLAHDSLRGRGSGTGDELASAQYLRDVFHSYRLESPPSGDLQSFRVYSHRVEREISSQNVLGVVPGSGSLADEWIVVGAHYDHIGLRMQPDGSWGINNGADDNASGTVVVLESARIFSEYLTSGGMPVEDRRSVLFAAFGAEELGLLGSCYYVEESPVVPLSMTRAMMNFDMVGRLRDRVLQVRGYGSSPDWSPMVVNSNRPNLLLHDPPVSCESCSDFACFNQAGVPYLWFFTGTHGEYHTPADDVEFINFQGLGEITELSLRVLIRLAIDLGPPG